MSNIQPRGKRSPTQLPRLKGRTAIVFVVIWALVFVTSVASELGGAWYQLREGAGYAYSWHAVGINLSDDNTTRVVALAEPAKTAGVRLGDHILAVDGLSLPQGGLSDKWQERMVLRLLKPEGYPVPIVVQSGNAPPRAAVLFHRASIGDLLYAGSGLTPTSLTRLSVLMSTTGPVILVVASCLLFRRRSNPVAAILSLALLVQAEGIGLSYLFWLHFGVTWYDDVLGPIGAGGMLLTMLLFPKGKFDPWWTTYIAALIPVGVLSEPIFPWMGAWVLLVFGCLAVIAMFVRYRKESLPERRQWRWAMIAFVPGFTAQVWLIWVYPRVNDHFADNLIFDIWWYVLTPLFQALPLVIIAVGVSLSVLRYRLYDTQAAVSRSLVFGALTITLLAIFAATERTVEILGEIYFGGSLGPLAGGLGAAFAAIAIAPLHRRISQWVEHRLQKNIIDLRNDLPAILIELGETSSVPAVADAALDRLMTDLHVTRGVVLAHGELAAIRGVVLIDVEAWRAAWTPHSGRTMRIERHDRLFPIQVPLGFDSGSWLLVGPRPDNSLCSKEERKVLSDLAFPISHALAIARSRTGRAAKTAARLDLIESEILTLRVALGRSLSASAQPKSQTRS